MKTSTLAVAWCLLLLPFHALSASVRGFSTSLDIDDCLVCNVGRIVVTHQDNERTSYFVCQGDDPQSPDGKSEQRYRLDDLPRDFQEKYAEQLHSGNSRICIPTGRANPETGRIEFHPNAESPRLLSSSVRHRELAVSATGTQTVLVVLVSSTAGESPGLTVDEVQGSVFGTGNSSANYANATLVYQYGNCSNGVLQLKPATGPNVVGGVLQYVYPGTISGGSIDPGGAVYVGLTDGVLANFGYSSTTSLKSVANHVMFCVPYGALSSGSASWVSFAVTSGAASFFNYGICQYLSNVMHENGHNLGFYHSGIGTNQYADESCYMGYSYTQVETPRMCFNAHKMFLTSWYQKRQLTYNPVTSGAWNGTLIPFVDYAAANGTMPSALVVVNVGTYYLQLNSKKSFNSDNHGEYPNMINIVQAPNANSISYLQAGLNTSQSFTVANYSGTLSLIFKVCTITLGTIDTATMTIYMSNQSPQC